MEKIPYKEQSLQKTIQNITNFFIQKGYNLKYQNYKSQSKYAFSITVNLYLKDIFILGANGKGATKQASIASALGELYERFCNHCPWGFSSSLIMPSLMMENKKKFNYYLDPDEKLLSLDDIKNSSLITGKFFNTICKGDSDLEKKCYKLFYGEQAVGVPYINFLTNEKKYFDFRAIYRMYTSTGMAAGNTLIEAFNQGLSEIFERYCACKFATQTFPIYYCINPESISHKNIQCLIQEIKQKNLILKIYDLSYLFKMPVILTAIIDPVNLIVSANYGAFPDFYIALERCLNEWYQGGTYSPLTLMAPTNNETSKEQTLIFSRNYKDYYRFCEKALLDIEYVNTPSEYFIYTQNKNLTNKEIYEYYKNLCEELNWEIFYRDTSLSKDISSIHIIVNNQIICSPIFEVLQDPKILNQEQISKIVNSLYFQAKTVSDILNNNFNMDLFLFENSIYDIDTYYNIYGHTLSCFLGGGDYFSPFNPTWNIINFCIQNIIRENPKELLNALDKVYENAVYFYPSIKKWLYLMNFRSFPSDKLIKISEVYNFNITEEEINNINNIKYNLFHYIFNKLKEIPYSELYQIFIKTLQKE